MRHFHRTHLVPDEVIALADEFFPGLGLSMTAAEERRRAFNGPLGSVELRLSSEGGHYTRIDAATNQTGESRLDRNVKRFFVMVHRAADPSHALRAAY
jgi:hypothetical protein